MRSASRPSFTPTMARWKLRWLKQLRRCLIRPTLKLNLQAPAKLRPDSRILGFQADQGSACVWPRHHRDDLIHRSQISVEVLDRDPAAQHDGVCERNASSKAVAGAGLIPGSATRGYRCRPPARLHGSIGKVPGNLSCCSTAREEDQNVRERHDADA